jgi:hypothetical protein
LEWAPANILSQSSTSKSDEKSDAAVGEHDAKRVILEQSVEGISEMDIDPDRIEVRHILFLLCICFVLFFFVFFHNYRYCKSFSFNLGIILLQGCELYK